MLTKIIKSIFFYIAYEIALPDPNNIIKAFLIKNLKENVEKKHFNEEIG